MSGRQPSRRKTHLVNERPPFERIALILQGGGALGAYQAGVYQALAEANLHPDWVAGISIGAVNSALIAGNPPERRVDRLREFWEGVSMSPFGVPYFAALEINDELIHTAVNQVRSLGILLGGAPGFFKPRVPPPFLYPNGSQPRLVHGVSERVTLRCNLYVSARASLVWSTRWTRRSTYGPELGNCTQRREANMNSSTALLSAARD